jgi:hypothetical protein
VSDAGWGGQPPYGYAPGGSGGAGGAGGAGGPSGPAGAPPGYGPPGQPYRGPYGARGPWVSQPPPDKHLGWAIGALVLFWPLCIPAFIASSKVSDLWFTGHYQESLQASADAKRWGRLGVIVGAVLSGLTILMYLVFAVAFIGGGVFTISG